MRVRPLRDGGWQSLSGRVYAPEEFDVMWYHEGDDPGAVPTAPGVIADLTAYLEAGGALLLSGAAGRMLNALGVEPTPLRVLGPAETAFVSGIRPVPAHRAHPVFAGFNGSDTILLTHRGSNALADFYGTSGPHGALLAEGNASLGERPLVEYTLGRGKVFFVGWRLADFTTVQDPYRPNLERLFGNLLGYLAANCTNRARLVPPAGDSRYVRLLGVPFLRAEKPTPLTAVLAGEKCAVLMTPDAGPGGTTFPVEGVHLRETPLVAGAVSAKALALTVTRHPSPVSTFLAERRAAEVAVARADQQKIAGLRVVKPVVRLLSAPLKPLNVPRVEQSVLLGRSPYMAPGDGWGSITPVYEPLEEGGFRMVNGKRRLNRPIVHGQNRVWTGDLPVFRMDTVTGNGSYAREERVFPLWDRPDAQVGNVNPCMGTLRLGVAGSGGAVRWLDEAPRVEAQFFPGYTDYRVEDPDAGWSAEVSVAPALDFHGMLCRVRFNRDLPLVWQYGGVWWSAGEKNANQVQIRGNVAQITEPRNLPNGLVLAAWDGTGAGRTLASAHGDTAEFAASQPQRVYHIAATWGVTRYDAERAQKSMARLDNPNTAAWKEERDRLKRLWFDAYIGRALDPEHHLRVLMLNPAHALQRTREWWDRRRAEFQVQTPDPHLNALANWARCVSEYHRQGPGLVLGAQIWQMYSHISTGWYGKEWGGDRQAVEENLRFYAAMQGEDGFIRWISPSLVAFNAENNTPYWVDQVWRHYTWTGQRGLLRDLWPAVRRAVAWHLRHNDPDGDGLFRDAYEYWNCDSNGKGPKAAAASAMGWAMLDRAARIAEALRESEAERQYRALAEKSRTAILTELWREEEGRLGSIGADGI
ncbi:MAG: GH116 family glycosyl hydrolase, partial [Armatimonadota bacterium]|nr:GH116 family glycosyl hydrolase [Armatimonadota bacterium]